MAKFRLKDKVVEATQWFKSGDHPEDDRETFNAGEGDFLGEGKVVRYFRHPAVAGESVCKACNFGDLPSSGRTMHEHGWLDYGQDGQIVCPGDWVITRTESGGYYAMKPDIFKATCKPMNYITAGMRRMEAEFVDEAPDRNINDIEDRHRRAIDAGIKHLRSVMFKAWEQSLSEAFQLGFNAGKETDGETKT